MIVWERDHQHFKDGKQVVHRFDNDFGASIITGSGSYTSGEDSYELAVISFNDDTNDSFTLRYDTVITEDVIGHLTLEEVNETLEQISKLEKAGE